ncbi:MAG: hypothetical protein WHV64_08670 [Geminicoccaceae bacterium]
MTLLAAVAAVGLLAMPDGALAQGRAFVADNVLWLPEVFAELNDETKRSVQGERRVEDQIFKKVQRALKRRDFGALTRGELERILSYSNSGYADRDLTPDDSDVFAYAGLDRMIGVDLGSTGSRTFRIDLSQNFLPTLLVPTVEGGAVTSYQALSDLYSIANVRKGKGGAKIARDGIEFDPDTGILEVELKKPLADKQFVNLIFELGDGSRSPKSGKRAARSTLPSFQVTIANVSLPTADADPIVVDGTIEGDAIVSRASDVEAAVTAPGRSGYRHFLLRDAAKAFPDDPAGAEIDAGGSVSDDDDGYTAIVTNGVLFNRFNVAVQVASPS